MDYQKTLEASLDSQKYLTREVRIKALLHDDDNDDDHNPRHGANYFGK